MTEQGQGRNRIVVQDLGPWVVEMEWPEGVTQGGPGALLIRPNEEDSYPPGGISSTVLRQIDFREAGEALRRQLAVSQMRAQWRELYEEGRAKRLREAASRGVTDEYLALLASAYVGYVNDGGTGPLAHLAEKVGKSESTIKGHLWQARKRGLLTGSAGRAGGELTEKATEILMEVVPGAKDLRPLADVVREAEVNQKRKEGD
ncbi:hypothetical protein LKL35_24255 [Streptomyces sp. ET3-23]|uniref:hypothetical protein n=1 Tax=Streptomyces sp. ET3-23 TaxID=2885643 RepID=UPI001D10D87E|nr:hypothetical protein [Streptomyces sp. ET3-23]MCC2278512.1 hypothetical protein [Streptomyces sp. ET3-23]